MRKLFAMLSKNDGDLPGFSSVDTHVLVAEEPPVQLILLFS